MRILLTLIAAAAGVTLARGAFAIEPSAAESLAGASGCFACHSINRKLVGPAYKDVATRYRNDASAETELIKKVKMGGKGVWGENIMPSNGHVQDRDIRAIVQWILSIK